MNHSFDDPSRTAPGEDGISGGTVNDNELAEKGTLTDSAWLQMFRGALDASDKYMNQLRPAWVRNFRAFGNKHVNGSKYETQPYRNRSKLHRPKTRMAVRKNDATTAGAMFSTEDVVSITAERKSDKLQSMVAALTHEVLNYRLDRSNRMCGPNWFLTAVGARHDTQMTGICVSKQFWEFEERTIPEFQDQPVFDELGQPSLDETGTPITERVIVDRTEIVRDRPMVTLIPPELAYIDPTGDWRDPIQEGGHFIVEFPMRLEDLEEMIEAQASRNRMGGGKWREIDTSKLTQGKSETSSLSNNVRRSRDDGSNRYDTSFSDRQGQTITLHECFYRYGGTDWHFWTVGKDTLLSDPRPVEESYPEQRGDRPYVRGVGALESHKTHPTAPVESWMPLQQEMNELTNLGLDAMKMSISPITRIRRGRGVDLRQVQNRGPDATIMVQEMDDVTFDRAPPPPPNVQQYLNNLNTDFDELAGVFSNGSVQTNRQMNETVGGMQLLSQSANALTEFDLRVWVETWVEPCLHQLVRCIQHYESDETILAVAGEKCGLIEANQAPAPQQPPAVPGIPPEGQAPEAQQGLQPPKQQNPNEPKITIEQAIAAMDSMKLSVRVNVGIGAMDSAQKLQKFMAGVKMTMDLAPLVAKDGVEPDGPAMLQEAWGLVGYKDADRFFRQKPAEQDKGPPPEAQMEMLKQKGAMQKLQAEGAVKMELAKMQANADQQALQVDAGLRERELALQERELAMQQRMDEFDMQMQQMREHSARVQTMLDQHNNQQAALQAQRNPAF